MDYTKYLIPGSIVCLVLITFLILTCWDTVDVTHYGLKCNKISKQCNIEDIYESGRFFTGPLNYFVEFPSTVQGISFSNDSG